jgi:hypothetical protein
MRRFPFRSVLPTSVLGRWALALALYAAILLALFRVRWVVKEVPVAQKLADCTNAVLTCDFVPTNRPRYHFVLGLPRGRATELRFRGELIISQTNRVLVRIPISSGDIRPCNWLPGMEGYVLTWTRTNEMDRLGALLLHSQSYQLRAEFLELPPTSSSLWFESMRRIRVGL